MHNYNLDTLSREQMISCMFDVHTGWLLGSAAQYIVKPQEGQSLIYVDMCNVHACNHKYTMSGTNARWIASFRSTDNLVKIGGDEIGIYVNDEDVGGFLRRVTEAMVHNGVYAVFVVLGTSGSFTEDINRADAMCSAIKLDLEQTGRKPNRDMPYVCLDSIVEYV